MFKFYRFTLYLLTFIFEASILNAFEALPLEDANISTVRLSLNLLGEEKVFAQKTSSADLGNGSFSWTGKVDDTPSSFLSFVCMSGYYNGSISMSDGRIFTFLGQNGELLFKPARKDFKSCGGCQVKGSLPPDPRHAAQSQRTWQDGDANLIDLLVVYPTVVKTAAGGTTALQALIASAIADTNLCYQNSLVQMQVRLVHSAEVNYTPTGTLAIELQRLEGKSDGYMDEIHTLRNTYGADLVAMLTTASDSGGLANTMSHPSLAFESSGFNVNIWDQLGAPSYTLAHEIGHNMGCLHNREDSDGDRSGYNFGSFSFGKRWIENGQGYATVMSYDTTPTSTYPNTIPYFSNPDVTYLSTPTGNANSEDNAQVLASTAPYVSNFRRSSVQAILPTSFSYFVGEGNSTSFSVRLTVEPSSPLTVNLAISGDNDLFLSGPSSLQFDSTNWNLPHPVQISAKPDSDNSAGSGTLILSASGINSTSIQITEIDVGTSIDSNPIFSGVILNELGMGIPQVVLTFSNSGGTTQTDENGTFRIGLTSGWSGTITPSLNGYSFSPSVITSQALSTNSLGNLLQASRSSILYVDRDTTGRGDGTSWANAYTDLSSALVSMNEFTEVWVAEGTYYPGNTKADSFILPPNTPVYGGFSGVESSRSERNSSAYITTLSGDIGTIGDGSDNSFHVVVPSQNSLLDGFVIRDGNASQNFTDYRGLGAGLFADRTEFIISNCSFINNQSYQRGGGVCIIDSNATFQNSEFTGHFSTIGGVIDANNSILILESCQFTNNSSELEGGVLNSIGSEVNATNCTFNSNQNTQNNGAGVVNVEGGTFSDVNGSYSNNQSLSKGGAFYAEGATLSFSNASFQSNQSVYQGGAVQTLDSNLTLVDTTFNANTSINNSGGAVYFENGTFSDVNGVYSQNISVYQGGALVLKNAQSQFSSSVFTGNQNSTTNGAGAVYLTDSNLSVLNCAFTSNSAAFQGGAIIWENSSGSITDSNFTENINTTSNGGGGISLKNSSPSILRCIFTGNVSQPSYGGALHLDNSSSTIEDSIFTLNKTNTFDGGAIYINSTSNPTITGNTFTSNVAGQSGGAINIESSANPTILKNTFSSNSSGGWGGAIYNSTTNLTLSQCMFLRNSSNFGGAVSSSGSVISFSDIHFLGNEANSSSSSSGGAVYFGTGSTSSLFVNCIISGNKSAGRHGVYRPKGATRFVNCALIGNEAGTDGGVTLMFSGDSIELDNSIIWNNSAGTGNDVWVNGGTASANYSLFNSSESIGTISGSNNLNSDPLFVDADGADNLYGSSDDNLSLQSTSPAIDQGSSSASNYSTLDINGRTRDANPDLGAFEYSSNTVPVFATTTTVSVSENQTAVIDINSTDSDNDVLSYSITGGNDQAKFQIDSGTGILTFINSPDFESPADSNGDGIYQVIITVSDSIDSISQEVSVSVIDGVDSIETFMVSGGQFSSPYYTITNAAGSVVDFSTYQFQKGGLYYFVASNISSSHPFMIGESYGDLTSSLVSGGPLTSSNNGSRITLNIPSGFNGQLLYFCTAHSGMRKDLLFSNAPPVISSGNNALSLSLSEDSSLSYDLNATDSDGDSLTWTISTGSTNGTASIESGTGVLSYTPTANYNGSDSLVVQVSDGSLSDSVTINLSISAVNDAPTVTDLNATLALTLPENSTLSYDLNATDSDGDTMTWTITTGSTNGTASIESSTGVLSYTPTSHYNGSDSLVVQVSDGSLSDSVTITLSISAVNDAPTVTDLNATLALTLPEGSSLSYDFNGTDTDGDSLTWTISIGPTNGTASIESSTGVLSYTPTANYNGSDSLIVQVSDGSLIDSVTITLSISSVNDAPVILDLNASLALSLLEDSTLSYDFNATDSDGDTMTWSITTGPTNGTASIDSGTGVLNYTPTANYSGMDSLAVQVSDGELSDNLTISLTVHSENDAPIIFGPSIAITISSAEDTNLTREMNASDPDGDSLVWRVETSPIHGMASVDSSTGFLNYVPNLNFVGLDSLTLEVSDGILFDRQVFNIVVTAVNDAPEISSVFEILDLNTTEDEGLSYDLNASDLDGDSLTWSVLSSPSNGSSSIDSSTGNLLYWPNPNYTGSDSLKVKVIDGSLDDNITVNLLIIPANDAPVIIESSSSLSFTFFEDQNFTREMNASDVDGDSLAWSISSSPTHGSASVNSSTGYLSYIPNSNFVGVDSLKVELSDGFLTDQQIFNFVMIEKNDAPVFTDSNDTLAFTLSEDQQLSRMINASDAEGDDISWSIRQAPTNGTASIISSTGMLFYLPNPNYFGSDLLTVQVSDGSQSSEISIYLSVLPVNDAPNNIYLSHSSVIEGLSAGYTIGLFTAEDPDHNQSHTFSLVSGSADNESFSLDLNGSLQTAEIFDFEEKSSYSIRVQTTDQGGMIFEKVFSIAISESAVHSVVLLSEGVSVSAGWKQAGWFGYYFSQSYPWIYHSNLGWIYVSESETTGLWLYREPLGWLWTNPSVFPHMFQNSDSNWLYLNLESEPISYFNYSTSNWKVIE